jgi:hypothetical protein
MSRDGEVSPRLGEFFRASVIELVEELGYTERLPRSDGIDLISDPPASRYPLLRFPFSPSGRTAFEFTSEARVRVEQEGSLLRRKIREVNHHPRARYSGVRGGVLITDMRLPENKIAAESERNTFCWDPRVLSILSSKIFLMKALSETETQPVAIREQRIDDWTTAIVRLFPYQGYTDGRIIIFYQNPLEHLDVEGFREKFTWLQSYVSERIRDMGGRVILGIQLHSLSEINEGVHREFIRKIRPRPAGRVVFERERCGLFSYARAPWAPILKSAEITSPRMIPVQAE